MHDFSQFEKNIGYTFSDKELLKTALTHSSYINEHGMNRRKCNERLEFLGDAVLELISSEFLFNGDPDIPEGEMTRLRASLVCEPALAGDAKQIGLSSFLFLGKGEDQNGGRYRDSIVSDAVEAVIGAIYLDGGLEAAGNFIRRFILQDNDSKEQYTDAKTLLQEIVQEMFPAAPEYRITGSEGPDHNRIFTAEVRVLDNVLGSGSGRTKKAAEQAAALQAMNAIKGNRE